MSVGKKRMVIRVCREGERRMVLKEFYEPVVR